MKGPIIGGSPFLPFVGPVGMASAAEAGTTVIGEGMARVEATAAEIPGSVILNDMPVFTGTAEQVTNKMMQYNRQWILQID